MEVECPRPSVDSSPIGRSFWGYFYIVLVFDKEFWGPLLVRE